MPQFLITIDLQYGLKSDSVSFPTLFLFKIVFEILPAEVLLKNFSIYVYGRILLRNFLFS